MKAFQSPPVTKKKIMAAVSTKKGRKEAGNETVREEDL